MIKSEIFILEEVRFLGILNSVLSIIFFFIQAPSVLPKKLR